MPELPEVETVKNGLTPYMEGKIIKDVVISQYKLREPIDSNFTDIVAGQKVVSLQRRAKILIIKLSGKINLLIHLGMSGSLTYCKANSSPAKHTHIVFKFSDIEVHYNDPRRFGFIILAHNSELPNVKYLRNLAPEPLTSDFNTLYLTDKLKNKKSEVKKAIMDNKVVVGVGNIYASESLYKAGIHPQSISSKIPSHKIEDLVLAIKETLEMAIKAGGSSLQDHKQADGTLGYFQHNFKVYDKNKEACPVGHNIEKITQAGRSTFYCKKCQFLYK